MSSAGAALGTAKKARDITDAMEKALVRTGMNPFAAPVLEMLLERLDEMTPEDWAAFYERYMPGRKLKTPGDSLALIKAHFRARLAEVESPVSEAV